MMSSRAYPWTAATTPCVAVTMPLGFGRSYLPRHEHDRPAPTGVSRTSPSRKRARPVHQTKAGESHFQRRSRRQRQHHRPACASTHAPDRDARVGYMEDRQPEEIILRLETEKDRCANTGLSRIQVELEFAGSRSDRRQTLSVRDSGHITRRPASPPREGFMYPRDMFRIVDRPAGRCQASLSASLSAASCLIAG